MIQTILMLIGILALSFIVNFLLKQSYNFLFFLLKKPSLWIISVLITAISFWYLSSVLGWSVSVPTWACTLAFLMNLPPSYDTDSDKQAANEAADVLYTDLGIRYGRLLYRAGLAAFVLASLGSWILFYGEICSSNGCIPIVDALTLVRT